MTASAFRTTTITLVLGVGWGCGLLGCGGATNGATGADASASGDGGGLDAGAIVPPTDGAALDAAGSNGDAGPRDAGAFACGDALCEPSQICLTPAYGCLAGPPNDAGVCPEGTEYEDASGRCEELPPAPSCVSPAPGVDAFDCFDSEGRVNPLCSTVTVPIPSGCSHICQGTCV
jgi:hypothetical protein